MIKGKEQNVISIPSRGTKFWRRYLEIKESKKILKAESIPEGWLKGRKIKKILAR